MIKYCMTETLADRRFPHVQDVHLLLQEAEDNERIRGKRFRFKPMKQQSPELRTEIGMSRSIDAWVLEDGFRRRLAVGHHIITKTKAELLEQKKDVSSDASRF